MRSAWLLLAWTVVWHSIATGAEPTNSLTLKQLRNAETLYFAGRYADAHALLKPLVDQSQPVRTRLPALRLMAVLSQASDLPEQAAKYAEAYLAAVRSFESRGYHTSISEKREICALLVEVFSQLGNLTAAERYYRSMPRAPSSFIQDDPVRDAETALQLAIAYQQANKPQRAADLYDQAAVAALDLINQIDNKKITVEFRDRATNILLECRRFHLELSAIVTPMRALIREHRESPKLKATLTTLNKVVFDESMPFEVVSPLLPLIADLELAVSIESNVLATPMCGQMLVLLANLYERRSHARVDPLDPTLTTLRRAADCYQAYCTANQTKRESDSTDSRPERVACLQALVDVYERLRMWSNADRVAVELLELQAQLLLAEDPAICRTRTTRGTLFAKAENFVSACDELSAALKQCRASEVEQREEILQNLAESERQLGRLPEAREHFEHCLDLMLGKRISSPTRIAEAHVNLGNVLLAMGDYSSAIEYFDEAERLSRAKGDKNRRLHSAALLGRAAVYKAQSRIDRAIDNCEAASEDLKNLVGVMPTEQIPVCATRATLHLARYELRGNPASSDLTDAEAAATEACELLQVGDVVPAPLVCQALHVKALVHFRNAQLASRVGDAQRATRECDFALSHWKHAQQTASGAGLAAAEARSCCQLAEANFLRSQWSDSESGGSYFDAAANYAVQAVDLSRRLEAYPVLRYRALVVRAKLIYQQARKLRNNPANEILLSRSTNLELADERTAEAIKLLQEAINIVEQPRAATLGSDSDRVEFFSQFVEAYELLINWLVETHFWRNASPTAASRLESRAGSSVITIGQMSQADTQPLDPLDAAAAFTQISRNRTFFEQVMLPESVLREVLEKQGKVDLFNQRSAALRKCEQLRCLIDLKQRGNKNADRDERAMKELSLAEKEADDAFSAIRRELPVYRNLLERGLTPDDWLAAKRATIGSDDLVVIYHFGPFASQIFTVTAVGVDCLPLMLSAEQADQLGALPGSVRNDTVAELVNRYLLTCKVVGDTRATQATVATDLREIEPLSDDAAVQLADLLWPKRLRELVAERKPNVITVIPDGALHWLPLEALLLSAGPKTYLDEETPPLCYAPSLMVLATLKERPTASLELPKVLTIGDVAFDPSLSRLPFTRIESDDWRAAFSMLAGAEVSQLLGDAASESNLRREVLGRHFIHLATHGKANPKGNSDFGASLELAPSAAASPPSDDDGQLALHEAYALPLASCELAVLSACESNIGPPRKFESGSTSARAFLAAGARRVVSSEWLVNDESAAVLMNEFANQIVSALKANKLPNYAIALSEARRRVRNHKDSKNESAWSAPYHWAPFILTGPAN